MLRRHSGAWVLVCLSWLWVMTPACDALSPDNAPQEKVEPAAPAVPPEVSAGYVSFFEGLAKAVRDNGGDCVAIGAALNKHLDAHPGEIKLFHAMVANKAPPWEVSPAERQKIERAMMESLELFQTEVERCGANEDIRKAGRRLLAPDDAAAAP